MDPLHMKVWADVNAAPAARQDAFYNAHSCDWLRLAGALTGLKLALSGLNGLHMFIRGKPGRSY